MGGRGASSASRRGGGASGEPTLPNGQKIEFEGTLHFDGDDKALIGRARQAIESWEKKRVGNKIEFGYAVDADGNPVGSEAKGGKGSVRVPRNFHDNPGGTFTHNHPRGDGELGGIFSGADLSNFARFSQRICRATAKEGTYSISKGKNFDSYGFRSYISSCQKKHKRFLREKAKSLGTAYMGGTISRTEYMSGSSKAFNSYLVELHESYRAGQSKYGYTYTLEKRRS